MSMRRFVPRFALALLLVAGAALAVVYRDQINLTTLDAWLGSFGVWAPIGYMVLFAVATVAFFPGAIFSVAGGALFGPIWGSLWNLLGATLGAGSREPHVAGELLDIQRREDFQRRPIIVLLALQAVKEASKRGPLRRFHRAHVGHSL